MEAVGAATGNTCCGLIVSRSAVLCVEQTPTGGGGGGEGVIINPIANTCHPAF